jgi:hypothetical protein
MEATRADVPVLWRRRVDEGGSFEMVQGRWRQVVGAAVGAAVDVRKTRLRRILALGVSALMCVTTLACTRDNPAWFETSEGSLGAPGDTVDSSSSSADSSSGVDASSAGSDASGSGSESASTSLGTTTLGSTSVATSATSGGTGVGGTTSAGPSSTSTSDTGVMTQGGECALAPGDSPCLVCIEGMCCAEYQECVDDDQCDCWIECYLEMLLPAECAMNCGAPPEDFMIVAACREMNCGQECS